MRTARCVGFSVATFCRPGVGLQKHTAKRGCVTWRAPRAAILGGDRNAEHSWRVLAATAAALCCWAACATAQKTVTDYIFAPREGDFIAHDFKFSDGQTLPEVRLHYSTLGTPKRDAGGRVTNAVMILHRHKPRRMWFMPLFGGRAICQSRSTAGCLKYYLILPDQLGAGLGKSTKPSDGLRAKFPHYDYSDMVRASQILLSQGLQVNHLHLLVGASMGCMEGFMWGESNPDDMDAMLLLSCLPVEVASRNRMVRKIMVDDIRLDPGWNNGTTQQPYGLRALRWGTCWWWQRPTRWQKEYPTAAACRQWRCERRVSSRT